MNPTNSDNTASSPEDELRNVECEDKCGHFTAADNTCEDCDAVICNKCMPEHRCFVR